MPYLDFEWPLDKLGCSDKLFEDGGLEPYVTELLEAVSVKLRDCLEKSIMSCLTRGCTCPLRLQIKVGCWNSDVHGQDSDPESDHPEDISWETLRPCKIIELRGLLGQFENRSPSVISCQSSEEASAPMSIEHGPEPNGIESAPQGFQQWSSVLWEHGPEPLPIEDGIESASQGFQPDSSMLLSIEEELELDQKRRRFSDVMASIESED